MGGTKHARVAEGISAALTKRRRRFNAYLGYQRTEITLEWYRASNSVAAGSSPVSPTNFPPMDFGAENTNLGTQGSIPCGKTIAASVGTGLSIRSLETQVRLLHAAPQLLKLNI